MPKYPEIILRIKNKESNYEIIISCLKALNENNLEKELDNFIEDITSRKYDLLTAVSRWFSIK